MDNAIIFIHSGMYLTEYLFVDTNVIMIGAAPGNVIDNVIIERGTESTITFVEGAKEAYLGYVTLKVSVLDICCFILKKSQRLIAAALPLICICGFCNNF